MTETVAGIEYELPKVFVIADNGIGQSEFAARTCYDSFELSENEDIKKVNRELENMTPDDIRRCLYDLDKSDLLEDLSFVYFHHSVIEHSNVTYFIKGTSRGVLQELARHRMASYSVRSTRYTLDQLMYIFLVAKLSLGDDTIAKNYFVTEALKLNLFVTNNDEYNSIELKGIWDKLVYQFNSMDLREFVGLIVPKTNIDDFLACTNADDGMEVLRRKKKRNVGDNFKHIITDNFKTDLTMTVNLRSLKNFFDLRLSGAAWFQIQWLAKAMKEVLPEHSKKLIFKES